MSEFTVGPYSFENRGSHCAQCGWPVLIDESNGERIFVNNGAGLCRTCCYIARKNGTDPEDVRQIYIARNAPERPLTITELIAKFHLAPGYDSMIRRVIRTGELRAHLAGKTWLVWREDFEDWFARRPRPGRPAS